jgi:hypothetical protein
MFNPLFRCGLTTMIMCILTWIPPMSTPRPKRPPDVALEEHPATQRVAAVLGPFLETSRWREGQTPASFLGPFRHLESTRDRVPCSRRCTDNLWLDFDQTDRAPISNKR